MSWMSGLSSAFMSLRLIDYLPGRTVAAGKHTAKSPTVRTSITAAWQAGEKLIIRFVRDCFGIDLPQTKELGG
jgi:hypothetical protein